jgi:dihydroneopterin aldolase
VSDTVIIRIENAPAPARVGVSEAERARPQTLRVTIALTLSDPPDFRDHDRIAATVDYDRILSFLREGLGEARLIETIAERIVAHCLSLSPRAIAAETTVEKPSVLNGEGHVSVTLRRTR